MKCLLVDDSKTMRNIQRKVLSTLPGIEFAEAGDGLEALTVVASSPGGFDLIVVDWNMPNMDGITFLKKFRQNDKRTVVIMATTEAEKARILDAVAAGVNNYVIKPFTPEVFLEKVSQTLAKAKAA